ncbi:MAG: hypothetical protein ABIZ70_13435 [Gemmatimonadales bacterium]
MRRWLLAVALLAPVGAPCQDPIPEVSELRRRITTMRGNLPDITEAAEYAVRLMSADSSLRFLSPMSVDAGFYRELFFHGGGPPETGNADDPTLPGVVILPVRTWSSGLGISMRVERLHSTRRVVITIGARVGKPSLPIGERLIDNGGTNDDSPPLNDLSNIVAWWTFYSEFLAAATRAGWQPGVYKSSPAPGAEAHNARVVFRMPAGAALTAVAPGQLGRQYLDGVEALLTAVATPTHRALVERGASLLRTARQGGATVFVASCGHYLLDEIPRDSLRTPFRPIDWRWEMGKRLSEAGARPGDAMLWFGFGGLDCPHAEVSNAFAVAQLQVVTLTGPTPPPAGSVALFIPAHWPQADGLARLPFAPGVAAPVASVEMVLHYLWIKRLVGGQRTPP